MTVLAQRNRNETVLMLSDALDAKTMRKLHAALGRAAAGAPVTIDFHGVRVPDLAIALLADELARAPRVTLVGLSEHHHRILRYLAPASLPDQLTLQAPQGAP